jgi:hypothetical protein
MQVPTQHSPPQHCPLLQHWPAQQLCVDDEQQPSAQQVLPSAQCAPWATGLQVPLSQMPSHGLSVSQRWPFLAGSGSQVPSSSLHFSQGLQSRQHSLDEVAHRPLSGQQT